MPVLSTIELTLRDEKSENAFLGAFTKAAGAAGGIPGLIELKAFKLLGAERTYMATTLWESEDHIKAWVEGPREQELIAAGKRDMLASSLVRRFAQIGADRRWTAG
ncbi:MAG: antibiotic biosynthesis monooxygenase [Deltaproteobacteria bacterium]|nr:antibiotic biosynthesis monooxygenase [Deltaproteobacteria bacterium]